MIELYNPTIQVALGGGTLFEWNCSQWLPALVLPRLHSTLSPSEILYQVLHFSTYFCTCVKLHSTFTLLINCFMLQ